MEGVPALPWAGDAGGRIILPKAVTYEQLAAGAVEFQLYNRQTNALIPTDILRVGDHIEIREKETGGDESPYTIDRYDGAKSEIALTGDGQATRIWGLMGAAFNDSIHSIRTFSFTREIAGDTYKIVSVEYDGKMYIPCIKANADFHPVIDIDGNFNEMYDGNYIKEGSAFPVVEVLLEDDPVLGQGAIMKIPSFGNITTESRNCIEIWYKAEYNNDEPWKYGQDGFFWLGAAWAVRTNGEWHAIEHNGQAVELDQADSVNMGDGGIDIYTTPDAGLILDAIDSGTIQQFKEDAETEFGITWSNNISVVNVADGDNMQPFTTIVIP